MEKLQRKAELIDRWLAENQPNQGAAGRENQINITGNDSAKMMTSHGVVQGYNSQALIDGKYQVIVHGEAYGAGRYKLKVPHFVTGLVWRSRVSWRDFRYFTPTLTLPPQGGGNFSPVAQCPKFSPPETGDGDNRPEKTERAEKSRPFG